MTSEINTRLIVEYWDDLGYTVRFALPSKSEHKSKISFDVYKIEHVKTEDKVERFYKRKDSSLLLVTMAEIDKAKPSVSGVVDDSALGVLIELNFENKIMRFKDSFDKFNDMLNRAHKRSIELINHVK